MTEEKIERIKKEYEAIAKEPLVVEYIGGTLYFFGSELACLRLFHKMPNRRAIYSPNRKSWVFVIELDYIS